MLRGQKLIYKKLRNNKKKIPFVFSLLLFMAYPAVCERIDDNASWIQKVITSSIVLPDSVYLDKHIYLKQINSNPYNNIVRQSLIDYLSKKSGVEICFTDNDSVNDCTHVLEYSILSLKVNTSEIGTGYILTPDSLKRKCEFNVKLNLFSKKENKLIWSGMCAKREEQIITYSKLVDTYSDIYSGLNVRPEKKILPTIVDSFLFLGIAGGVIYFLYR